MFLKESYENVAADDIERMNNIPSMETVIYCRLPQTFANNLYLVQNRPSISFDPYSNCLILCYTGERRGDLSPPPPPPPKNTKYIQPRNICENCVFPSKFE